MEVFGYNIYKSKSPQPDKIRKLIQPIIDKVYAEYDGDLIKHSNADIGPPNSRNFNVASSRNLDTFDTQIFNNLKFFDEFLEDIIRKNLGDIGDYEIKFVNRYINRYDWGTGLDVHADTRFDKNNISYSDITSKRFANTPDFTVTYYPICDFGCGDFVLHNPLFYNHRDYTKIESDDDNIWGIQSKINMNITAGDIIMHPFFLPHSVQYSHENLYFDDNISQVSRRFAIVSYIKIIRR